MNRVFLCGITSNEYKNIKELTDPVWEVVDGLIFCVDDKAKEDGTLELLEERKGEGEILYREWNNWHDAQMNVWLASKKLKDGDWCVFRDSLERFNSEWVKGLPQLLESLALQKVNTVFNYGKIFAFKYHDGLYFIGSPHFGLHGARPMSIDLKDNFSEEDHEHTWRIRDGEEGGRPVDNKINHEAKYLWVYGRSNHMQLGVNPDDQIAYAMMDRAETIRQVMRHYADKIDVEGCNIESVDGLKAFMKYLREEDPEQLGHFVNSHRVWKNFFRYHFIEDKFEDIEATENLWEYKPIELVK